MKASISAYSGRGWGNEMNIKELKEFIKDLPDDMIVVSDDTFSLDTKYCSTFARVDDWWDDASLLEVSVLAIYTRC